MDHTSCRQSVGNLVDRLGCEWESDGGQRPLCAELGGVKWATFCGVGGGTWQVLFCVTVAQGVAVAGSAL